MIKRIGVAVALALAIGAGPKPEESTGIADGDLSAPAAVLTAVGVLTTPGITYVAKTCGDNEYCGGGEHRVIVDPEIFEPEFEGLHQECWAPAAHFGPPCEGDFDLAELRTMTLDQIEQLVRDNPDGGLIVSQVGEWVDVYNCTRTEIVGRVAFTQLAE